MQTTNDHAALVWLDHSHALIARSVDEEILVTEVDQEIDSEAAYLLRVVHEAADCDRLIVMGSDGARVALERKYVALYRRPDRLIDAGMELEPEPRELADRLGFLAGPGQPSA